MKTRINRRQFIANTGALGVGFWINASSARAESRSPNEKLNIGCIGVGGKGDSDSNDAGAENVVALCDVDANTLNKKAAKYPNAKKYSDYRKMLDEVKEIEAVTVSTADHTHAPASVMAMRLGKHCFCQKPLTHDVYEARLMREIAAEKKVATQMGNQGTSERGLRRAVEIVQAGGIGDVKEVHIWTNRPVWAQSPKIKARPSWTDPVPPHIDWDLFLGTAPERPFALPRKVENRFTEGFEGYHNFQWRGWWDFGTGALGDMACHTANMANMALKLSAPTSVSGESEPVNPETCPGWARVTYEFPARGEMPPVKVTWYEGKRAGTKLLPPVELFQGQKIVDSGSLLVGAKGILYSPNDYGAAYKLLPEKDFADYKGPPETIPRSPGHFKEWLDACKGGKPAMSNFDYAGPFSEWVLLGNVAIKVGKKFAWDGEKLKADSAEANALIKRVYRKGWEI